MSCWRLCHELLRFSYCCSFCGLLIGVSCCLFCCRFNLFSLFSLLFIFCLFLFLFFPIYFLFFSTEARTSFFQLALYFSSFLLVLFFSLLSVLFFFSTVVSPIKVSGCLVSLLNNLLEKWWCSIWKIRYRVVRIILKPSFFYTLCNGFFNMPRNIFGRNVYKMC